MKLVLPDESRLRALLEWFSNDEAVIQWGGPHMRLPMTLDTLKTDARLDELASFFLIDAETTLGFGQYYARHEHCHLGRLAIAPERRGQRLGETLIELLGRSGRNALNLSNESLFVLGNNAPAIRLYERIGFAFTAYPGNDIDMEDVRYMVRRVKDHSR